MKFQSKDLNVLICAFKLMVFFIIYYVYLISGRYIPNAVTYCTLSNIPPLRSGRKGILEIPECAGSLNYNKDQINYSIRMQKSSDIWYLVILLQFTFMFDILNVSLFSRHEAMLIRYCFSIHQSHNLIFCY